MSQRDRGQFFAIVTALTFAIGGCLLVAFGWSIGELNSHYTHRANQNSDQYAGHTKERVQKECTNADTLRVLECVQEIVEASREAQQSEYDLSAQEAMADFALWMVLASVAGLVLSLGGLLALYLSLSQTRTAIRDNREIGEAQTRAYLACADSIFAVVGDNLILHLTVKNFGTSPTKNIMVQARAYHIAGPDRVQVFTHIGRMRMYGIQPGSVGEAMIVFKETPETAAMFAEFRNVKKQVSAEVTLKWQDVFDKDQTSVAHLIGSGANVEKDGTIIHKGTLKPVGNLPVDDQTGNSKI